MSRRVLDLCGSPGIRALAPGGAAVHLRGMARGFVEEGWELDLVAGRRDPLPGQVAAPWDLPLVEAPRGRLPGVLRRRSPALERQVDGRAFAAFARRRARAAPPSLCWERLCLFLDAGRGVRTLTGAPWAVEMNASVAWEACWWEGLRPSRRLLDAEVRTLHDADHVFAVSQALADLCVRRGVPVSRVTVLPQGHDGPRRAGPVPRDPRAPFVLGYEGTWKAWQGLAEAGPALLDLRDRLDPRPLHLDLWGEGPERSRALAVLRNLPHIVPTWHGSAGAEALDQARERWDAAWVPLLPWPPAIGTQADTDAIRRVFGEDLPDRWFQPLKLAAAAAAGLPTFRGGPGLHAPDPPPPSWAQVASQALRVMGW